MTSIARRLNIIYGSTVCILGFLSSAILVVPLALLEPLRLLGTLPHAVLVYLRDVLVELAWKPMMVMLWLANVRVLISRPDSYRFPGEGGWLPDREKSRKFVVNANHQNLGDTLLIAYLMNSLNATNGSGMWTIWETYKSLPLLWACHLAGHLFLSKRTVTGDLDFSSFQRDKFSHLLFYAEGGCLTEESLAKAKEYAKEQGLPEPRHTQVPRAGLLHILLPELHAAGVTDFIDLTIAYPPGCDALKSKWSLTEFGTLKRQPYDVHINVKRFPLVAAGSSLEEVQESLNKLYQEKDALLDRCAADGCFPDSQPLAVPICWWTVQVLAWVTLLWCMFSLFGRVAAAICAAGWQFAVVLTLCVVGLGAGWWNNKELLGGKGRPLFATAALAVVALSATACSTLPSRLE